MSVKATWAYAKQQLCHIKKTVLAFLYHHHVLNPELVLNETSNELKTVLNFTIKLYYTYVYVELSGSPTSRCLVQLRQLMIISSNVTISTCGSEKSRGKPVAYT